MALDTTNFQSALSRFHSELLDSTGSGTVNTVPATTPVTSGRASAVPPLPANPYSDSAILGNVTSAVTSAASGLFTGLFSTRVIAIILGIVVIAGALYLFGANAPVQIVQDALKKAKG